jgi:hypothetical protein
MPENFSAYPVKISIDFPDQKLNRLTTFFRPFLAIPVLIILGLLLGSGYNWWKNGGEHNYWAVGFLFLPVLLLILFSQKYPKWWFDWNVNLLKFGARVFTFLFLLRDEYPSVEEEQAVHIEIKYPDVKEDLNRWMPLIKWFLAIPHIICLFFLYIAIGIVVLIAWFAILFTGRYPKGLFDFVVGVMRWDLRVICYAFLLTTDKYPPFSLN